MHGDLSDIGTLDRWWRMHNEEDDVVCPLCGSASTRLAYDLTAAGFADAVPGRVMRCRACALWFKATPPAVRIPTEYSGETGDDAIAQTYLHSDAARTLFRAVLTNLRASVGGSRPRLLDIGTAQGALLEEAGRMGFDAEGIDHSASNVRSACARGLRVTLAAAEGLGAVEAFDAITMIDIIEHLHDPLRVLRAAHRALKPGGELAVYTPNHRAAVVLLARALYAAGVRQPVHEIFGRNHLCFFDDRSLPLALRRTGFELTALQRFPYDPARPGQDMSRLSLAVVAVVECMGRPVRRVFRMLAYARKPVATAGHS